MRATKESTWPGRSDPAADRCRSGSGRLPRRPDAAGTIALTALGFTRTRRPLELVALRRRRRAAARARLGAGRRRPPAAGPGSAVTSARWRPPRRGRARRPRRPGSTTNAASRRPALRDEDLRRRESRLDARATRGSTPARPSWPGSGGRVAEREGPSVADVVTGRAEGNVHEGTAWPDAHRGRHRGADDDRTDDGRATTGTTTGRWHRRRDAPTDAEPTRVREHAAYVFDLDGVVRDFAPGDARTPPSRRRSACPPGTVAATAFRSELLAADDHGSAQTSTSGIAAICTELEHVVPEPARVRKHMEAWRDPPRHGRSTRPSSGSRRCASDGHRTYVFTNGTDYVPAGARAARPRRRLFDGVLNSADFGVAKPDPQAYAAAHRAIEADLGRVGGPGRRMVHGRPRRQRRGRARVRLGRRAVHPLSIELDGELVTSTEGVPRAGPLRARWRPRSVGQPRTSDSPLGSTSTVTVWPVADLAGEQRPGEPVADLALHETAQRSRTIGRVVAARREPLAGVVGDLQGDAPVGQAASRRPEPAGRRCARGRRGSARRRRRPRRAG